jgi:hypothetical protein
MSLFMGLIIVYPVNHNLLNYPLINLARLQETIQTYLLSENFVLLMKSFILIIIAFIKQISLEYDTIGIELEYPDLNTMDITYGIELVNKQDVYTPLQDLDQNPYNSMDKTIEAQGHMNKIRAN